jgi:hypothetical protein
MSVEFFPFVQIPSALVYIHVSVGLWVYSESETLLPIRLVLDSTFLRMEHLWMPGRISQAY